METKNEYDYIAIVAQQPKSTKITLARNFGIPLIQLHTDALFAFFQTHPCSEKQLMFWNTEAASKYFVASLYCFLHRKDEKYIKGTISFQECLRNVYQNTPSKSGKLKIQNLFDTDFTSGGSLERKLKSIIISNPEAFMHADLSSLQKDIQNWNSKKTLNTPRNRWAKKLVYNEKIDNENTENDNQGE